MKKSLAIFILSATASISGCGNGIYADQVREGQELCELNGGVNEFSVYSNKYFNKVHCKNGGVFELEIPSEE